MNTEKITILGHRWERNGSRAKLYLKARDQMRRPVALEISVKGMTDEVADGAVALDMTPGAAAGIVNGLAEIAWAGGWRPKGLMPALMKAISDTPAKEG